MDHCVSVVTSYRARDKRVLSGVNVYEFDLAGNHVDGYSGKTSAYQGFVRDFKCDVLVAECAQTWVTDLILPILHEINSIKVLHSHDFSWLKCKSKNPAKNLLRHFYFRRLARYVGDFDRVFVLDESLSDAQWLKSRCGRIPDVIPNGVSDLFFSSQENSYVENLLSSFGLKRGRYLLCVANYGALKNQVGLLREYLLSGTDLDLVFIGSQFNQYSQGLIDQVGISAANLPAKVLVLDGVSRLDISVFMREAYAFVYASLLEAFPLVLCESIVSGTPWIAYDVGCINSLPGGLVVDRSKGGIKEKIQELCASEDLYRRLLSACKSHRDQFSYDEIVSSFTDLVSVGTVGVDL